MSLPDNILADIKRRLPNYRAYLKTPEGHSDLETRRSKMALFQNTFAKANLSRMTELDLGKVISSLWALRGWTNKQYVTEAIMSENGIELLRAQFDKLLYGTGSLANRYDEFRTAISGMGPAQISEILAFTFPNQYGLWNDKTRKALSTLGFRSEIPVKKYDITGLEYEKINDVFRRIASVLSSEGFESNDMIEVDFFLFWVQASEELPFITEVVDFDHREVIEKLLQIGSGLGFETAPEKLVAAGAKVDVIWQAKIANLGVVTYVFEVQKSGSIDSLILNLQRAKNNPSVQRLVVVSNAQGISKVQKEIETLQEEFRKAIAYFSVTDVLRAAQLITDFNDVMNKLELVKPSFI